MNSSPDGYGRSSARWAVLIATMLGSVPAAQAALNGTLYAVVSPIYDGSNGSTSFLRLYGGVGSAGSTFEISVVRTIDGAVLGTTNIAVPKNASPQFEMHTILAKANVGEVPDHGYAFYLRNPEPTAGYQHVTYNGLSTLFENVNNCAFMLNCTPSAPMRQNRGGE